MDYKGLRAILSLPKDLKIGPIKLSSDVIIMLLVMILASVWDLVYAVGIGLVAASLMFMKKMGDLTGERSNVKPLLKEEAWADELGFSENLSKGVFIKHIQGPLFFGSTSEFQQLAKQIPANASAVIIRMDRMSYIDQSGLYALEDVLTDLIKRNIEIFLVDVQKQPKYMMERIDIIPDLVSNDAIFSSFKDCATRIETTEKASA